MSEEQRREFEAEMIAKILFTLSNWVDGGAVYRDKKQKEARVWWRWESGLIGETVERRMAEWPRPKPRSQRDRQKDDRQSLALQPQLE